MIAGRSLAKRDRNNRNYLRDEGCQKPDWPGRDGMRDSRPRFCQGRLRSAAIGIGLSRRRPRVRAPSTPPDFARAFGASFV